MIKVNCIYFCYERDSVLPVILAQQDGYSLVTVSELAKGLKRGTRIYVQIGDKIFATRAYGKSA